MASVGYASGRVKCTYDGCFRYFSSEKDMKSHKRKEPSHEYCHKCDVDCEDDLELLIHMIESGRHIVCPMCGMEFKSNAGLEAHIPQTHQHTQSLACIGCNTKFARAASLMQHIEDGECAVISQEVFQQRRAEKAITRDAWAAQLQPDSGSVRRGIGTNFSESEASAMGGVALMDDEIGSEKAIGGALHPDQLSESMRLLSMREKYPKLPGQEDEKEVNHDGEKSNMLASYRNVASSGCGEKSSADDSLPRPTNQAGTAAPAPEPFSAEKHAHVKVQPAPIAPARILDPMTCFNSLTSKFECPGSRCRGVFDSIEAFNKHLKSDVHTGSDATCPSCLRRFKSTMALVSHCEAPSKRCNIRKTANFNQVLRDITGGLIGTEGYHIDGSVRYVANDISQPGFW